MELQANWVQYKRKASLSAPKDTSKLKSKLLRICVKIGRSLILKRLLLYFALCLVRAQRVRCPSSVSKCVHCSSSLELRLSAQTNWWNSSWAFLIMNLFTQLMRKLYFCRTLCKVSKLKQFKSVALTQMFKVYQHPLMNRKLWCSSNS